MPNERRSRKKTKNEAKSKPNKTDKILFNGATFTRNKSTFQMHRAVRPSESTVSGRICGVRFTPSERSCCAGMLNAAMRRSLNELENQLRRNRPFVVQAVYVYQWPAGLLAYPFASCRRKINFVRRPLFPKYDSFCRAGSRA